MLVLEDSNVQSSAYVISLMPSGGSVNRDMYRLNNVGDNTPPCLTHLYLELMFLNVIARLTSSSVNCMLECGSF